MRCHASFPFVCFTFWALQTTPQRYSSQSASSSFSSWENPLVHIFPVLYPACLVPSSMNHQARAMGCVISER